MKRVFKALWAGWKKFAHALGVFNTRVILTVLYFTVIAVASMVVWILRKDLIERSFEGSGSMWNGRSAGSAPNLDEAKRQF